MQSIFKSSAMRLTICGVGDVPHFCDADVSHLVSILDPGSDEPEGLDAFSAHQRLDLRFHDIIDERHGMVCPRRDDIHRLLAFGRAIDSRPDARAHLLIHCQAGISRSTAAMILLLAQALGDEPAETAVGRTLEIKSHAWPNLRMIELGDGLLGRGGALTAAVRQHYANMVKAFPGLGSVLRQGRHLRDGAA